MLKPLSTNFYNFLTGTQQFGERVKIGLAELINNISRGRFHFEPQFTGQNKLDMDYLKDKYKLFHDDDKYGGYKQTDKSLRAFYGSNISYRRCCNLWLCLSRVDKELRKEADRLDTLQTPWDDDEVPY